jgi:hypothetical protein
MKITVCGSIAFYGEMEKLQEALEVKGHEVRIPLLSNESPAMGGDRKTYFGKYIEDNGGIDAFPVGHALWDMKESAIKDHYEKIEWGDAILVANYEKRGLHGYVGGNTLIEMGLAFFLKKPIYLLNPVTSELSYKQEILGMKPVLLNGDLNLISNNNPSRLS